MREFSREYLRTTRAGMWEGDRTALAPLELPERERVLDVGCGTGEFSRVLREECPGTVYGVDADPDLLAVAREHGEAVAGDAYALPLGADGVDLVTCQALLVNLARPAEAVAEFSRVAAEAVGVVEPDNAAVRIESTVEAEPALAARARRAYRRGVETEVAFDASSLVVLLEAAGLSDVRTRTYEHVREIAPPYDEDDLEAVRRTASGEGIAGDRPELLAGGLSAAEYETLRDRWRAMGRTAIEQARAGEYRRRETVPFTVAVGTVPPG